MAGTIYGEFMGYSLIDETVLRVVLTDFVESIGFMAVLRRRMLPQAECLLVSVSRYVGQVCLCAW